MPFTAFPLITAHFTLTTKKMKITHILLALAILLITGCTAITYQGKYANITGTPGGAVIITPKYAK